MEFLKRQFERIQQQLGALTVTQKMLAAALVVIMVMTLYWWASFAGRAEMEAVLDQPMNTEDVSVITSRLRAQGIPYKVVGDRILVPVDRKMEVLADLGYSQMLPRDTENAFDEISNKISPFSTTGQQEQMWNQARQTTLAQVLRRFPRVAHAVVMIDPKRERGPNGVEPSATINITMRSGEQPDPKLINAAADLVAGAVARLSRGRIRVIVDGVSYPVRDREDSPAGASDEWLAQVQKAERYYADKLSHQFSWIDGAMISVSVKPNFERSEKLKSEVDPKNILSKPVSEESTTDETQNITKGPTETGVMSNAGMAVGDTPGGDKSIANTEKIKTDYIVEVGRSQTKTWNPGGDMSVTAASVLIPRSYFTQVYKRRTNTSDREPDPQALSEFIRAELGQVIKPSVKTCLGLAADDSVHVDAYTDLMPAVAAAPQAASAGGPLSLGSHAKEIALGVLALVSLFMITQMVKKGTPAPALAPQAIARAPRPLGGVEETVGEATEGSPMLDGMELDEDSVKAQQMIGQVSQMVDENPDGAAALVKRWLNRA